jgi:ferredoxin-type protein NapH
MSEVTHSSAGLRSRNDPQGWTALRWAFALMVFAGLVLWILALVGRQVGQGWTAFFLTYGLLTVGGIGWSVDVYRLSGAGVRNHGNYHRAVQRGGWAGWVLVMLLGAFYAAYYADTYVHGGPHYLAAASRLLDPLSALLRGEGRGAHHWFLYGYLYSVFMVVFGARMFLRYRHSRYQMARTASVLFFQLLLAFFIPYFLEALHQPVFYPTYFWPLAPEVLYPSGYESLTGHPGGWGVYFFWWALALTFLATPVFTYLWGKRWYCSWVCGCGGLAETAGDPFRHLSSKTLAAWRFERWSVHLVLVVVTLGTVLLWVELATGAQLLGSASRLFRSLYGFIVVSLLAGAVGTTLYPVFGSRVWCRFFCPMAAILGIFQRYLSRFRITTNGDQCMSCGNCSTYCEMGIDVRSYAQRGANIVRASCVGPRGVLNLEDGATHADRFPGADKPLAELKRSLTRSGARAKGGI